MTTKTNKTTRTNTKAKKNVKPSLEEWYNGLSKPAKQAFKVGVQYALQLKKEEEQLKKVLAL